MVARPGRITSVVPFADRFQKLTAKAAEMIDTSIALLTAPDRNARSFNGRLGSHLRGNAMTQVGDLHHLAAGGKLVINDLSEDDRTLSLPCVTDYPYLRFYAGVPIIVGGRAVGTLEVMDHGARPDGICLLESFALSGFAACASLLWEKPTGSVLRS
jgi:GAF domain-containing protein